MPDFNLTNPDLTPIDFEPVDPAPVGETATERALRNSGTAFGNVQCVQILTHNSMYGSLSEVFKGILKCSD